MSIPKVPAFVRKWGRSMGLRPEEIAAELVGACGDEHDPDWELVSKGLLDEDKYSNISEFVFRHRQSGRFVRVLSRSLPYGINDYGMEEYDEDDDVEEVFPVRVTVTKYLDRKEIQKGGAA